MLFRLGKFAVVGLLLAGLRVSGAAQRRPEHPQACPTLIEFSGEQGNPADVQLPEVSGRVLIYYWSQLEPKKNRFDFREMDREVAMWTGAGKFVVLRFSTAGWTKWREPWSQKGTPEWALRKYYIDTVTEVDGAVLPVYWSPGYIAGLSQFLQSIAEHIRSSAWREKVAYVEIGVGDGGETKPDTEQNKTPEQRAARLALWQKAGYTNAIWYQTISRVIGTYKQAFPSTPLALMPDSTFLGGDCAPPVPECREKAILSLARQEGLILQDNGFDRNHVYPAEWHNGGPLACEQLISATRQGYPLADDLQQSVKAGCSWFLVFRQDLQRSDFQQQVKDFYQGCGR